MVNSNKLLDHYIPPYQGLTLESLIATTYQVDFEFVEEQLLATALGIRTPTSRVRAFRTEIERSLRRKSVSILYDLRGNPGAKRSSPQIDPLPIQDRKLHAKISLIMWVRPGDEIDDPPTRYVRLIVGSANLTTAGFRENYECIAALDFESERPGPKDVLTKAIGYLEAVSTPTGSPALARQLGEFRTFSDTVVAGAQEQDQPMAFVSADEVLKTLSDEWKKLDGSRPSAVTVVSPFWPEGAAAASALKELVNTLSAPKRVDLVCRGALSSDGKEWVPEFDAGIAAKLRAQIDSKLFLRPALRSAGVDDEDADKGDETEAEEIGRALSADTPGAAAMRALHAKMIFVDGEKGSLLYIGSSNCTRRGMGLGGQTNWEAGLVYRLSRSRRNHAQRLLDMAGKPIEVLPGKPPKSITPLREPDEPVPEFLAEVVATRSTVTVRFRRGATLPADLVILMPIPGKLEDHWRLYQGGEDRSPQKRVEVKLADCPRCDDRQKVLPPLSPEEFFGPNVFVDVFWDHKKGVFPVRFDDKVSLPLLLAGRRSTEGELIDYFLFGREPDPGDEDGGGSRGKGHPVEQDAPVDTRRILAYFIRRFVQAIPGIEAEVARAAYSRVALEATLRGPTSPLELAERAFASLSRPTAADEPSKTPTAVGFELVEIIAALKRCRSRVTDKDLKACFDPVIKRCAELLEQLTLHSEALRTAAFKGYRGEFVE